VTTRSAILVCALVGLIADVGLSAAQGTGRGRVQGVVTDAETGTPVSGAIVSVGQLEVTTSDDGKFLLTGTERGEVEVVVIADGYEVGLVTVNGRSRVTIELTAALGAEIILVEGRAPVSAQEDTYTITADEIRALPGSGNDALKALQSLPGVSRVPLGLGGLVLRGASPRDSSVYLDGIEVPILYHFGGLASFYPSSLLDDIDLQSGSFGARWGRTQGGVVALTSRAGRADRWRVGSEISLIDASLRAEGPAPGHGSWSVGLRRSYVDAILAAALPRGEGALTLLPRYWDGQLRYDRGKLATGQFTAMVFFSDDLLRLASPDLQPDEASMDDGSLRYVSRFARAAVRYQRQVGDTDISVQPWIGLGKVAVLVDGQGTTRTNLPIGLRTEVVRHVGASELAIGLDLQGGRSELAALSDRAPGPGVIPTDGMEVARATTLWHGDLGAWAEGRVRLGRALVTPGLRLDRYGLSDEWVIDPRLGYAQELSSAATLHAAIGRYHQPPLFSDVDPLYPDQPLVASSAIQTSLGIEVELPAEAAVAITGFTSDSDKLLVDVVTGATSAASGGTSDSGGIASISGELLDDQFGAYEYREPVGRGRSRGVELLVKRSGPRWSGWLSYTWSRSERTGDPSRSYDWRPYVLDQPHVLTALATTALGPWQLGGRVRYASGNPYTPVAGTFYDTDSQTYQPYDGPVLSARLPAFFELDLRVDRTWKRPWGAIKLFLDVQNVTNRVNPEGVTYNFDYTEREYTRGLPVFPSIGVEYVP